MTVLLHTWVQQMIVLPTHKRSSADEYATPHQGPADECAAHTQSEGVQQMYVLPTHTRSSADEYAAPHQGPADECAAHTHKGVQQMIVLPTLTRRSADECAAPHQGPADECAAHNPPSIPDSAPKWVTVCVNTCFKGTPPNY